MSERMLPAIIDYNTRHGEVTILNLGQSSANTLYKENIRYLTCLKNVAKDIVIYNGKGIQNKRDVRDQVYCFESIKLIDEICASKNIDAIVLDDSRASHLNLLLGEYCNKVGIKLFANTHGNNDVHEWNEVNCLSNPFYYKLFVFGQYEVKHHEKKYANQKYIAGGIPENDVIKIAKKVPQQITVIVNRVVVDGPSTERLFDFSVFQQMKLQELQKNLNLPIVFKIKDRMSEDTDRDINALKSSIPKDIDYSIVVQLKNEVDFLAKSKIILTHGSTMAFKALQLNIPTVIFKETGPVGLFSTYRGTISLEEDYFEILQYLTHDYIESFLPDILEGSTTFDATQRYSDALSKEFIL